MSLSLAHTCTTLLINSLIIILETECVDGCNYLYLKVPTNTTCNIQEDGSAFFGCDAAGICNTFSVLWFKHTNEASIRTNSSERISQSDGPNNKYQILNPGPLAVANGHCIVCTILIINRFNHSDSGYYWCQIVPNNNCPLLPSPRGYVAVGDDDDACRFERLLPSPICAEDTRSLRSEEMGCVSLKIMPTTVAIDLFSTHNHKINLTTATSMTAIYDNNRHDNMVWLYGLMAAFLIVIIALVLILVIVRIKFRIQQKQKSNSPCDEFRLDNTVPQKGDSPGYAEIAEVANKEEQEGPSTALTRSPSPVYAEVHEDKKKEKQQEDCSVVDRRQSPEYTEVENVNKHSGYTMESNISYNTLQGLVSNVNTDDHDELGIYKHSVRISTTSCTRAIQSYSSDYDDVN